MYRNDVKIAMVTAHDYPSAVLCEKANVDIVLVGDSLGMVALGYDSTVPVTMDEMIHHCKAVARGSKTPFIVGDMPFGSYQVSKEKAIENAIRFVQEGKVEAVKLEGGAKMADKIRGIVDAGILVMGHIGLTPQSQVMLGGFRVQGKTADNALKLVEEAKILQDAGCFSIVLEAMPEPVATYITEQLDIPTIGIGAGPNCSGQVLVQQDMLGMFDKFVPKFCKLYANLNDQVTSAISEYVKEVKSVSFPQKQHTYEMDEKELNLFHEKIKDKQ
ncbi:hypothetical protein MP638_003327 [Amoeboaphelidium occidentale]|nr:hypothetical protein MP638_003327 [Amoeboaphelidium occidentale]